MINENHLHDSDFNPNQIYVICLITKIMSGISIASCLFVFFIYLIFKEIRNFNHEIIVWLTLSNLFYSLTSYLPYNTNSEDMWCAIQSFTLTWFQNASLVWSCIIGYTAFINVINRTHLEKKRVRYRFIFIIISFIITGGLACMYI